MPDTWKTDIQDVALIDAAKADFIFDSAKQFLGETIEVADNLRKSSMTTLGFFIATLPAIAGFLLVKCDPRAGVCKDYPHMFAPGVILLGGYFIAAVVLIVGCLMPRYFHFRGNEPRNLLKTDVCQYDLPRIKVGEAISMQNRITQNVASNLSGARCLLTAYLVAVGVPLLSFLVAVFKNG